MPTTSKNKAGERTGDETVPGLAGKLLVAVLLTAVIFLLLGLYGDLDQVGSSIFRFRWKFLPLILGLAFINYILRFVKWDRYIRVLNVPLTRRESLAVFFAGLAMSVTPAKFGEVLKAYLIKRRCGIPMSRTAPIIFAERVTDFLALVLLTLLGAIGFQYGRIVSLVGLLLVCLLLVMIFQRNIWNRCVGLAESVPRFGRWARKMDTAYESTVELLRPRELFVATVLSLPAWLAEGIGCYLAFRGLDVFISLSSAVCIYSTSTLVGALTMLPGGIGGTEGSLTALAILSGASKPAAVSATVIIRVCTLWFAVLLGMIVFFRLHLGWKGGIGSADGEKQ